MGCEYEETECLLSQISNRLKYLKTPFDLNQSCIKFGFVAELKTFKVFLLLQISDQVTWVNPLKRLPNLSKSVVVKNHKVFNNTLCITGAK